LACEDEHPSLASCRHFESRTRNTTKPLMTTQALVSILDDDASIVLALARMLHAEGFLTRTWTSAASFLATFNPEIPGCLLTDLIMPDMSGLELQRALAARDCSVPIVFFSGRRDIAATVQAMRGGAVGFLCKPVRRAELIAAVREAIAQDTASRAKLGLRRRVRALMQDLTPRESQVLELVALGMTNKEIAALLGAAEKTVKVHRGRLMEKMRVRSAAALLQLLLAADLAPMPLALRARAPASHLCS